MPTPEMPADGATDAEIPKPPDVAANGAMPKPPDVPVDAAAATGESRSEPRPSETVARSEHGTLDSVIPAPPPPAPLEVPGRFQDQPQERRPGPVPEITIDVIRSRGRWRAFGVGMTVLLAGLVAMLAAWRFVPDRLPAVLRPANLMMSIGIDPSPQGLRVKPAPPESQFDE
jgi:hypothetical protein